MFYFFEGFFTQPVLICLHIPRTLMPLSDEDEEHIGNDMVPHPHGHVDTQWVIRSSAFADGGG